MSELYSEMAIVEVCPPLLVLNPVKYKEKGMIQNHHFWKMPNFIGI